MDGPIFRIGRALTIDFQVDRNSQDRLELAYRLVETVNCALDTSKSHLEATLSDEVASPLCTLEIHG